MANLYFFVANIPMVDEWQNLWYDKMNVFHERNRSMKPIKLLGAGLSLLLPLELLPGAALQSSEPAQLYLTSFSAPEAYAQALHEGGYLVTDSDGVSHEMPDEPLPSFYDQRLEGLTPFVKNQDEYGTCWAFAALNCLETSQITREPLINLSEWHLAFYTYSPVFGYPYSTSNPFDAGSYDTDQEIGILTSWLGPVYEQDAYYGFDLPAELSMDEVRAQSVLHTTAAIGYPYQVPCETDEDTDESEAIFACQIANCKRAILSGSALDCVYTQCDACYSASSNAYCYQEELAEEEESYGHSVCIVGWDDDFPASAFRTDPGRDGAWLCRNSWGVGWGDDGFFWISYADPSICDIYAFDAEPAQEHPLLYQYDDLGNTGAFASEAGGDETISIANVFRADRTLWVTSVMLCNMTVDDTVSFQVYSALQTADDPSSGIPSGPTVRTLSQLGYQTIELDTPVQVKEGELFAVTARLSGSEPSYRIPCEFAVHSEAHYADGTIDVTETQYSPEMLRNGFAPGQSFYSADGEHWSDMYDVTPVTIMDGDPEDSEYSFSIMEQGNICLKALAREAGRVIFSDYHSSIPAGEGIELSTAENAPIYYSLNDSDFQPYDGAIRFPEGETEMTITAYAGIRGREPYTQSYRVQRADASSVLCRDANRLRYLLRDEEDDTKLHGYIDKGITSVSLKPISTGQMRIGDMPVHSGEYVTLPVKRGRNFFELEISEEGLAPQTYTIEIETRFSANFLRGDVNLDGIINAADASEILVFASAAGAGETPYFEDDEWYDRADFNEDEQIDAVDASDILYFAAQNGSGAENEM